MIELFAGVGGFRLGLKDFGWEAVWANQWEPSTRAQHAAECYRAHFGDDSFSNENIGAVVRRLTRRTSNSIPSHDLLVGGFPCQDYSVAKARGQALGIAGEKGALWWAIQRIIKVRRPRFVFLENVDRLLRSPAGTRGWDFSVILASLSELGYLTEWRVINAADYGFPQRRIRVFIVAQHVGDQPHRMMGEPLEWLCNRGILARAFPVDSLHMSDSAPDFRIGSLRSGLAAMRAGDGLGPRVFESAGVVAGSDVWTQSLRPRFRGRRRMLSNVLEEGRVPRSFYVPRAQIPVWKELKGAKRIERVTPTGFRYVYSEGRMAFPDPVDQPSRTILTGEGGSTPSRFKHVVRTSTGRLRRLVPVELERLNGFPDGWTDTGLSDSRRAFLMGNALVVGLVRRVGRVLASEALDSAADESSVA